MWTHWFGWESTLIAFLFFHAFKGVDMMMQAYVLIYENRASSPEVDAQAEGRGYILNWSNGRYNRCWRLCVQETYDFGTRNVQHFFL